MLLLSELLFSSLLLSRRQHGYFIKPGSVCYLRCLSCILIVNYVSSFIAHAFYVSIGIVQIYSNYWQFDNVNPSTGLIVVRHISQFLSLFSTESIDVVCIHIFWGCMVHLGQLPTLQMVVLLTDVQFISPFKSCFDSMTVFDVLLYCY